MEVAYLGATVADLMIVNTSVSGDLYQLRIEN